MFESCLKKQQQLVSVFAACHTPDERYQKIIQLGKTQQILPSEKKNESTRVRGCQSNMYLISEFRDGRVNHFLGYLRIGYVTADSEDRVPG